MMKMNRPGLLPWKLNEIHVHGIILLPDVVGLVALLGPIRRAVTFSS